MAFTVELDDELKERIEKLARAQNCSPDWITEEAISEYVSREEARESFKAEAIASWQAYKENGQHLTLQEARNWLRTWGTSNEVEVPPCHD